MPGRAREEPRWFTRALATRRSKEGDRRASGDATVQ